MGLGHLDQNNFGIFSQRQKSFFLDLIFLKLNNYAFFEGAMKWKVLNLLLGAGF